MIIENPLVVSFIPAAGVDEEIAANGIQMEITIKETFGTYDHDGNSETDEIDIFYIGEEGKTEKTFLLNDGKPIKNATNIALTDYIKLNEDITLPTKADYDKLFAILNNTTQYYFEITISEVVETAQS